MLLETHLKRESEKVDGMLIKSGHNKYVTVFRNVKTRPIFFFSSVSAPQDRSAIQYV